MAHSPPMSPVAAEPVPYREVTIAAVLLGIVVGAAMTASFVYISLKLGFGYYVRVVTNLIREL